MFRYKLLYEKGGIWVDMDVTCLKFLDFNEEYLFRAHHKNELVGNIMKCPVNSDLMLYCYQTAKSKINADNKDWMLPLTILKNGIEKYNLKQYVFDVSNKDSWPIVAKLLKNDNKVDSWYAIHWMNEEWRRLNISKSDFLPNSCIGRLMSKHNIRYNAIKKGKLAYYFKVGRINYSLINLPFQLRQLLKQ